MPKKATRQERLKNRGWISLEETKEETIDLDDVEGHKVPEEELRKAKERHGITEEDLLVK